MATHGEITSAYLNCLAVATQFLKKAGHQVEYKGAHVPAQW